MIAEDRKIELLKRDLWDAYDLAEYLEMSIGSVRNMVTRGEVAGLRRINKKLWRVHVKTFIEWFSHQPIEKKHRKPTKGKRL